MGRTIVTVLLLLFSAYGAFAESDTVNAHPRWSSLHYEASKFFITLKSQLEFSEIALPQAYGEMIASPKEDLVPMNATEVLKISSESKLFGTKTKYTLWFNPDASVLQRLKIRAGDKNDIKLYRFATHGYYEYSKKRRQESLKFELGELQAVSPAYKSLNETVGSDGALTDSAWLLYLASHHDFEARPSSPAYTVVSRGDVYHIKLTSVGESQLWVEYVEIKDGKERRINGNRKVHNVSVMPSRQGENLKREFNLMGLEGELKLFVDKQTGVLVQLSGEADVLGTVTVNVKKAVAAQ